MACDVTGIIHFYSHTIDGTFPWADADPKFGWVTSNYVQEPVPVSIHNLRGREDSVDLDTNGFQLLKYDGRIHEEFEDNSDSQRCYFEEIEARLKEHLGASRVIVFNHIFRFRGPARATGECDLTHKNPVLYPHIDNNSRGAQLKLEEVLSKEEASKALKKRWQIVNVWRPLGPHPVTNMPLTICDYSSIDTTKDIHVSEARTSHVSSEVYMVSRNAQDAHRWYFLSDMRSDEMFVFKNYESNPDVAQFGAHTAFVNQQAPVTDGKQKSIEIRCLVLYEHWAIKSSETDSTEKQDEGCQALSRTHPQVERIFPYRSATSKERVVLWLSSGFLFSQPWLLAMILFLSKEKTVSDERRIIASSISVKRILESTAGTDLRRSFWRLFCLGKRWHSNIFHRTKAHEVLRDCFLLDAHDCYSSYNSTGRIQQEDIHA